MSELIARGGGKPEGSPLEEAAEPPPEDRQAVLADLKTLIAQFKLTKVELLSLTVNVLPVPQELPGSSLTMSSSSNMILFAKRNS